MNNLLSVVKAINSIENRRFVATNDNDTVVVYGHSMGYQSDTMYNKFECVIKCVKNQYVIDYSSTLFEKQYNTGLHYSTYEATDIAKNKFTFSDEQQLIDWFEPKNLTKVAVHLHDWDIVLID